MSKMMKAEVKVVRFGCADVIATSSLVNGEYYYTYGDELNQSYDNKTNYVTMTLYRFEYKENAIKNADVGVPDDNIYYYAWYNDGAWYTQHISYRSKPSGHFEWDDVINGASYT